MSKANQRLRDNYAAPGSCLAHQFDLRNGDGGSLLHVRESSDSGSVCRLIARDGRRGIVLGRQHELAKRTQNGIVVRLLWDSLRDRVVVRYRDERSGDSFQADIPRNRALDVFYHPNAYRPALIAA